MTNLDVKYVGSFDTGEVILSNDEIKLGRIQLTAALFQRIIDLANSELGEQLQQLHLSSDEDLGIYGRELLFGPTIEGSAIALFGSAVRNAKSSGNKSAILPSKDWVDLTVNNLDINEAGEVEPGWFGDCTGNDDPSLQVKGLEVVAAAIVTSNIFKDRQTFAWFDDVVSFQSI